MFSTGSPLSKSLAGNTTTEKDLQDLLGTVTKDVWTMKLALYIHRSVGGYLRPTDRYKKHFNFLLALGRPNLLLPATTVTTLGMALPSN